MITAQDIEMAVDVGKGSASSDLLQRPWQERHVVEVMHRTNIRVTPQTGVAAATQLLVEQGLSCLSVVEYESMAEEQTDSPVLVGLLTRSDLLLILTRAMGAYEPGVQLLLPLPLGNLTPLAQTLLLAMESHIQVRSITAIPGEGGVPHTATLHLGTINPAPLLLRLQESNISYTFAAPQSEGNAHGKHK